MQLKRKIHYTAKTDLYGALEVAVCRLLGEADADVLAEAGVVETALGGDVEQLLLRRERDDEDAQAIYLQLHARRLAVVLGEKQVVFKIYIIYVFTYIFRCRKLHLSLDRTMTQLLANFLNLLCLVYNKVNCVVLIAVIYL